MKKDLAEFLYSKLNCSFRTAYETLDMDYKEEINRRENEKKSGVDEILSPHATSFNSSGNLENVGRPSGSTAKGNEINDKKVEYDKNYQESKIT